MGSRNGRWASISVSTVISLPLKVLKEGSNILLHIYLFNIVFKQQYIVGLRDRGDPVLQIEELLGGLSVFYLIVLKSYPGEDDLKVVLDTVVSLSSNSFICNASFSSLVFTKTSSYTNSVRCLYSSKIRVSTFSF